MPELLVLIDNKPTPLHDCAWVEYASCGCAVSVAMAAMDDGSRALPTEDDARRHLEPSKRARDKQIRQGDRLELMTMDRYHAEVELAVRCPHLKGDTTQQTLDPAQGATRA
ncbi:hypothetical protein [Streptomyces sp. NBRC 110035]|uniref:hypothetical protein n=1 Tax=Streptomyces sp. NBRC 110035 TaxID=1547867 RepID=UPI0005A965E7|nr:hypothetical protein [Streptomyces sp. NBRC 110035]